MESHKQPPTDALSVIVLETFSTNQAATGKAYLTVLRATATTMYLSSNDDHC